MTASGFLDHVVDGRPVLAGAAVLEAVTAAVRASLTDGSPALVGMSFGPPLLLPLSSSASRASVVCVVGVAPSSGTFQLVACEPLGTLVHARGGAVVCVEDALELGAGGTPSSSLAQRDTGLIGQAQVDPRFRRAGFYTPPSILEAFMGCSSPALRSGASKFPSSLASFYPAGELSGESLAGFVVGDGSPTPGAVRTLRLSSIRRASQRGGGAQLHRLEFSGVSLEVLDQAGKEADLVASPPVAQSRAPLTGDAASLMSLEAFVKAAVEEIVGEEIAVDEPMRAAGLDSILAVELCRSLGLRLHMTLSPVVTFNFPTISSLAGHLHGRLESARGVGTGDASVLPPTLARVSSAGPAPFIAIRSCAGRTFAGAVTCALRDDAVRVGPLARWDVDGLAPESGTVARFGVFLEDVEAFDIALFGVQAPEAKLMDPQHRLLLLVSADALLGTGMGPSIASDLGVYVGIWSADHARLSSQHSHGLSAFTATGSSSSVAAGRLSYTFGAQGPSVSIDTACSSSLVGAHVARVGLVGGEARSALVRGGGGD